MIQSLTVAAMENYLVEMAMTNLPEALEIIPSMIGMLHKINW